MRSLITGVKFVDSIFWRELTIFSIEAWLLELILNSTERSIEPSPSSAAVTGISWIEIGAFEVLFIVAEYFP